MTKLIHLTQGRVAIVDDSDYEYLSQYVWHYSKGYASRNMQVGLKRVKAHMHRIIAGTPDGMDTDHINGDKLDNRRSNLRVCTRSQNRMNVGKEKKGSSIYKGVSWYEGKMCWQVKICVNRKLLHVGYFEDEVVAARAWNEAAKKYHGAFARLNDLPAVDMQPAATVGQEPTA